MISCKCWFSQGWAQLWPVTASCPDKLMEEASGGRKTAPNEQSSSSEGQILRGAKAEHGTKLFWFPACFTHMDNEQNQRKIQLLALPCAEHRSCPCRCFLRLSWSLPWADSSPQQWEQLWTSSGEVGESPASRTRLWLQGWVGTQLH